MNQKELSDYCSLFYDAFLIPLSLYTSSGEHIFSHPSYLNTIHRPFIPKRSAYGAPDTFTTSSHGIYGVIYLQSDNKILLIGPVFSVPMTNSLVREFMKENAVALSLKEQTATMLSSIPVMSYNQFFKQLLFVHYCLNKECLSFQNSTIQNFEADTKASMFSTHINQSVKNKENQYFHNTFYWEQELYHVIQEGSVQKLNQFLAREHTLSQLVGGMMADSPIRQAKNLFIGTVTKVGTLAAIPKGLDVEQVYQLIDMYTQECEKLHSEQDIQKLYHSMLLDFTSRMADLNIPEGISQDVHICMTFIRNHTNESISISDVAKQIQRSNSYTINKFKQELGINIGAFIMRCKLEEAKSLLAYSEKSLAEISSYLCFSSQSYFQNVFKKQYGVTPLQYRRQPHK